MRRKAAIGALSLLALSAAAVSTTAYAQDPAAVARGEAKFQHSCAPCHADGPGDDGRPMLPGTEALSVKYKGEIPAVLEHRSGLTKEVIAVFVRQGSWSMPPFRPTELSDDEIADIAAYLSVSSRQAAARR